MATMLQVSLNDLLDYTEWQRAKWQAVFQHLRPEVLGVTGEFHDFLFSPVLGGAFTRGQSPP